MEITKFEKRMIKTISEYTPYSSCEVKRIWEKCHKSYDKTIYCLNKSRQLGILPDALCE